MDSETLEQKKELLERLNGVDKRHPPLQLLEQLYNLEPFAILEYLAQHPSGRVWLKAYLKENPSHSNTLIHSYNLDDSHYMYGSMNGGIACMHHGNSGLLKDLVKYGMKLDWQDHLGKNLLHHFMSDASLSSCTMWYSFAGHQSESMKATVKWMEKQQNMIEWLIGHPSFKALNTKKAWNGYTPKETFDYSLKEGKQRTLTQHIPTETYNEKMKSVLSKWESAILRQEVSPKSARSSPRKM